MKKKDFFASFSVLTKFIKSSAKFQSLYLLLRTASLFDGSVKQHVCNKTPSRKWKVNADNTLIPFRN